MKVQWQIKETAGIQLRLASQKAGLIDSITEDEIRRCRLLLADLSDDNAGAYWEAGFAEGLGKPIIYLCSEKDKLTGLLKATHFDTSHRHTVYWNLMDIGETEKCLKAVIRNTLLGDAIQEYYLLHAPNVKLQGVVATAFVGGTSCRHNRVGASGSTEVSSRHAAWSRSLSMRPIST
jgi:hypothetical protein